MTHQKTFNPINYNFMFDDKGWYTWDTAKAKRAALQARNAYAKELRAEGYSVRKFSEAGQLVTRGGIGTGQPQISHVVTVYGVSFWK